MKKLALVFALFSIAVNCVAQNADAVIGKWTNSSKEAQITITKKADKYFGKLSWLKIPNDAAGKPKTDVNNPQNNLKVQPLSGLEILKNFKYDGNNGYTDGTIYDPKNGKTYSCNMTLNGQLLKIRGYIGISLLGRTDVWTRVE